MKLYFSFISIIPIYLYHDFWLLKPNIFAKFPQYPVLRCKLQTINSSFSLQKVSLYCFGVKFLWLKVCGLRMFFFKTVIFSVLVYHQIIQNIRSYSGEAGLLCTHWTWFFFFVSLWTVDLFTGVNCLELFSDFCQKIWLF